jgi:hypothetical protein
MKHAWLTKTFVFEWTRLLPSAAMEVIDFVRQTVCYESTQRLKADLCQSHQTRSSIERAVALPRVELWLILPSLLETLSIFLEPPRSFRARQLQTRWTELRGLNDHYQIWRNTSEDANLQGTVGKV